MLKVMFLIVLIACIGPFFIKAPNGEPLLSTADFATDASLASMIVRFKEAPRLASLTDLADSIDLVGDASDSEQGAGKSTSGSVTKVYKWRDDQGVWQFSDGSNHAEEAELVEISSQINLMPALKIVEQLPVADGSATSTSSVIQASKAGAFDFSKLPAGVTSVAPEQLMQMAHTIETFQKVIDDQGKTLEALVPSQP